MTDDFLEKRSRGYVTCRGSESCSNITPEGVFKPSVKACAQKKCSDLKEEEYFGVQRKICGINERIPGNLERCPKEVMQAGMNGIKESRQLGKVAAVPDLEEEENRYPLLGYLVYWSMVDVRISPYDLRQLFISCGVDEKYFPPKIREPDAFRRATSGVSELSKSRPHVLEDGTNLTLMVREVRSDITEIIVRLVGEVRDSKNKKLGYYEFLDFIFSFRGREVSIEYLKDYSKTDRIESVATKAYYEVLKEYEDLKKNYTGKHIREMTRKAIQTCGPVNMRPNSGAGGLWFVPIDYQDLVLSFDRLVKQLNNFRVASGEAIFDNIPLLDVERQRALIFSKYESQVEEKVDSTMSEIKCILDANKSVSSGVVKKYLAQVKELRQGIVQYEGLLEKHMDISREKTRILEEQVNALLDRAGDEEGLT